MTGLRLQNLHQVFFDTLKDAVSYPLYDTPPEEAAMPFITIGEWESRPRYTFDDHTLFDLFVTLGVWVSGDSQLDLHAVMDEVVGSLETMILDVPESRTLTIEIQSMNTLKQMRDTGPFMEGRMQVLVRVASGPSIS